MSNKILIYLNSDELTIEVLLETMKSKLSENADLEFSLKTEEESGTKGLSEDLIHYIQIAWPYVMDFGYDVARDVAVGGTAGYILKKFQPQEVIDALKTHFKERGTAKKTIITVETKKGKTIKQMADKEIPIKLNPEDEIEVIHVEEQ